MDRMSVFDEQQPTAVDQLVGEGKKYATVDELAKAYANANQFLEQVKGENSGLRDELERRVGAEDLFKKIVERTPEPAPIVAAPKADTPVGEPSVDLAQKIREGLAAAREEEQATSNATTVINKLVELYGDEDKAGQIVAAKAAELGVSVAFLQDVAIKSPKAFFTTIGISDSSQPAASLAPRGNVNTAALQPVQGSSTPGTYEYFERLRKEAGPQYWKPAIQNQIFEAKKAGTYVVPL